MTKLPPVLCLDCERPLRGAVSRARRIGEHCWRRRRRETAALVPPVLPGLPAGGGPAGQHGPDLFDDNPADEAQEVV